mgnify:CR=1 FL=1
MNITREQGRIWLEKLKNYWGNKEPENASLLFKETTFYQETPFAKPYTTYDEIKEEWKNIEKQEIKKLEFSILAIEKNTMIVHWNFENNTTILDGIYEIKFNKDMECIYFKSWEMENKE